MMTKLLLPAFVVFTLTACGGGGSGGDNDADAGMEGMNEMMDDEGMEQQPPEQRPAMSQFVHEGAEVSSTCPTCSSHDDLPNAIDGDDESFAEANFPVGSQAGTFSTWVDAAAGVSFPAGTNVGALLFLQAAGAGIAYTVTVNTYLGDTLQESFGPESATSPTNNQEFSFESSEPYDAVETVIQYTVTAGGVTSAFSVRHFEFRG